MRSTISIGLATVFAAAPVQAQSDPLAPATTGMVQCHWPDTARKTCKSMAYFKRVGAAAYDDRAIVLIVPQGPVTLEGVTSVTVKGGAVCGTIRRRDLLASTLRVGRTTLSAEQAAPTLARVAQTRASMIDKEICSRYLTDGDAITVKASIDGTDQPALDHPTIWVKESDGYTVAP